MITVETLGSSSKGNCYRLLSGGRSLLLECGLPWKEIRRKLNFETSELDGCLASHAHQDHFKAARDLIRAGVDVFASKDTFEYGAIEIPNHRAITVQNGEGFVVADFWKCLAFDIVHDVPCLGYIITDDKGDTLAFLTDTAYCKYKMPACNIIMIEANFDDQILQRNVEAGHIEPARAKRIRENHMSIDRVVEFLKSNDLSRCREIRLLHLSDGNSNAADFKRRVQEATGIMTIVEGE